MADDEKVGFRTIVGSVFSAMIGVQSNEKRIRDFSKGRPRDFILAGLLFTGLFILTIFVVVKLVLHFVMG